jgi:hypothetical protein
LQMVDPEKTQELFRALEAEAVEYVLVGAIALDVHGMGRLTQDIDLFVNPDETNVERLRKALLRVWEDPEISQIRAEDLAGEFPVIRYISPDGAQVDVMSRLGDALSYTDLEASVLAYGDVEVRVATPQTLYLMKRDSSRMQDQADAHKLREGFRLED